MRLSEVLAVVAHPVAIITIVVLVVAVVGAAVLSVIIARLGKAAQAPDQPAAASAPAPAPVAPRPATPRPAPVEVDMQERLRRLTANLDLATGTMAGDEAHGAGHEAYAGVAPSAPGSRGSSAPVDAPRASTRVVPTDDATRFFGSEAEDADATTFFAAPEGDGDEDAAPDATRFFGEDAEDGAALSDATTYFGDGLDHSRELPDATTFFGEEAAPRATGEHDDATRFFGQEDLQAGAPTPVAGAGAGPTGAGLLRALPPATKGSVWDTDRESAPVFDTGRLTRVRERLASVSAPEVLALSVMDGSGRVLAGETDADLTGELRSLMAESGQGNTADVEQPVTLADASSGAILLLPTGANALLGALIRDADDPQATRASLRGLAHDIGEAIRRAS